MIDSKKYFNLSTVALVLVTAATLYYILIFSLYSILLQETFFTQAFDAGIDDQGIWLLSRFLPPFVTVRGLNLFGDSMTLYHLFFAPFFWIWDNINILYIIQSLFLGLGAIPIFLYAKEKLKSNLLAIAISFSFLLYPALQNLNLDQFHSEAIAVFFMILTLYFMEKENYKLFWVFWPLTMIAKDEVALTGIFIGIYLIFFKNKKKQGGITAVLSLIWFLLCSRIFAPIFNEVGVFAPQPPTYSHWFRGLMNNLLNPTYYLNNIFHKESLKYYFDLLAPVAFIPLFSPATLFLAIPSVAVNVLSGVGYLRSIDYHYNYITIAVIYFALTKGLNFFLRARLYNKLFLSMLLILTAFFSNNYLSHLPYFYHLGKIKNQTELLNSFEVKAKKKAVKLIPKESKVSASYSLVPHLSHRREIYMFPNPFKVCLWNQWFQEGTCPLQKDMLILLLLIGRSTEEKKKLFLTIY